MMTLTIKGVEYKVKYGFNSFVDTDLMERTESMIKIFDDKANAEDKYGMGRIKEMFSVVRELLFVGFQKYNPVESLEAVGNLLDDYMEEGTEENPHDLLEIFGQISHELMEEGFLKGVMTAVEKTAKKPQDHLKAQK